MPELPEVEVTRRVLHAQVRGQRISAVTVRHHQLRVPVPDHLPQILTGQRLNELSRRGKYLLWEFERGVLVTHLGMSGSWRVLTGDQDQVPGPHDHLDLIFEKRVLRLNDPRRFGSVQWLPAAAGSWSRLPALARLGIEPFDAMFDGAYLHHGLRGRRTSIKQVLLAGEVVVGVGNIYASESLHRARIHPATPAERLGRLRCERLAQVIVEVLGAAIAAGGSTLQNFSSPAGDYGEYIRDARVYGREGQPCLRCGRPIRKIVQQQRATFFCSHCQRR